MVKKKIQSDFTFQKGFIDPLSLIALGFLVVSLLIGTYVITKSDANFNPFSQAAKNEGLGCGGKGYCQKGYHCQRQVCVPDSGQDVNNASDCVPGNTYCFSGTQTASCVASGGGKNYAHFESPVSCPAGQVCKGGGCTTGTANIGNTNEKDTGKTDDKSSQNQPNPLPDFTAAKATCEFYGGFWNTTLNICGQGKGNCESFGGIWDGKTCTTPECVAGFSICDGGKLKTCSKDKKYISQTCQYGCSNNACNTPPPPVTTTVIQSQPQQQQPTKKFATRESCIDNCRTQNIPSDLKGRCTQGCIIYATDNEKKAEVSNKLDALTFGSFSEYTKAFSPDKVILAWQQAGYKSLQECQQVLGKKYGARAAISCNTYELTKDQAASSIKLGGAITSEVALGLTGVGSVGELLTGASLKAVGGEFLTSTLAIQAQNSLTNATSTCITDPATGKCYEEAALAALSFINVGAVDYAARALASGGQALQTAKLVSSGVSALNTGFTGYQAAKSCLGEEKSVVGCAVNTIFTAATAYTGISEFRDYYANRTILNSSEAEAALSTILETNVNATTKEVLTSPEAQNKMLLSLTEVKQPSLLSQIPETGGGANITILPDQTTVKLSSNGSLSVNLPGSTDIQNAVADTVAEVKNLVHSTPETGGGITFKSPLTTDLEPQLIPTSEIDNAFAPGSSIADLLGVDGSALTPEETTLLSQIYGNTPVIAPEVAPIAQTTIESQPNLTTRVSDWWKNNILDEDGIFLPKLYDQTPGVKFESDILGPSEVPTINSGVDLTAQVKVDQAKLLTDTHLPNPRLIEENPNQYAQGLRDVAQNNGLEIPVIPQNPTKDELEKATGEVLRGLSERYDIAEELIPYEAGLATTDLTNAPINALPEPSDSVLQGITEPIFAPAIPEEIAALKDSLNQEAANLVKEIKIARYIDPATNLLNKNGGEEILKIVLNEAKGEVVTVADVGIGNMKFVNDTMGHEAGDRLMQESANLYTSTLRSLGPEYAEARVIHLGGNKFRIILPGKNNEEALQVIERISADLQALKLKNPTDKIVSNMDFDTGIVEWNGIQSPEDLGKAAADLRAQNKDIRVAIELHNTPPISQEILGPAEPPLGITGIELQNQLAADQRSLLNATKMPDPKQMAENPQGYIDGLNQVVKENGFEPLNIPQNPTAEDLQLAGAKVEKALIDKYEAFTPRLVQEYKITLATRDLTKIPLNTTPELDVNISNAVFASEDEELALLRLRVQNLKVALNDAQYKDALTGLYNKRAADIGISEAINLAEQSEGQVSLIGIDVAGLGEINRTLGEKAGDEMIQEAADIFDKVARRSTDIVFRGVGDEVDALKVFHAHGDEYGVVLPGTDKGGAQKVISRFYEELTARKLANPDNVILQKLNFDAGAVEWNGIESAESLTVRADGAMYVNKQARKAVQATAESIPEPSSPTIWERAQQVINDLRVRIFGAPTPPIATEQEIQALTDEVGIVLPPEPKTPLFTQSPASKAAKYLTGHSIEDSENLISKIRSDQQQILESFGLPEPQLRRADPQAYLDEVKAIANKNDIQIKALEEIPAEFKSKAPNVKDFYDDAWGTNAVYVKDPNSLNIEDLQKLEHEVVHALDYRLTPDMPIELKEYRAYVSEYNLGGLVDQSGNPDKKVLEFIFGDWQITGSTKNYLAEQGISALPWDVPINEVTNSVTPSLTSEFVPIPETPPTPNILERIQKSINDLRVRIFGQPTPPVSEITTVQERLSDMDIFISEDPIRWGKSAINKYLRSASANDGLVEEQILQHLEPFLKPEVITEEYKALSISQKIDYLQNKTISFGSSTEDLFSLDSIEKFGRSNISNDQAVRQFTRSEFLDLKLVNNSQIQKVVSLVPEINSVTLTVQEDGTPVWSVLYKGEENILRTGSTNLSSSEIQNRLLELPSVVPTTKIIDVGSGRSVILTKKIQGNFADSLRDEEAIISVVRKLEKLGFEPDFIPDGSLNMTNFIVSSDGSVYYVDRDIFAYLLDNPSFTSSIEATNNINKDIELFLQTNKEQRASLGIEIPTPPTPNIFQKTLPWLYDNKGKVAIFTTGGAVILQNYNNIQNTLGGWWNNITNIFVPKTQESATTIPQALVNQSGKNEVVAPQTQPQKEEAVVSKPQTLQLKDNTQQVKILNTAIVGGNTGIKYSPSFVPDNLVVLNDRIKGAKFDLWIKAEMIEEAVDPVQDWVSWVNNQGYTPLITDAYRSYETQEAYSRSYGNQAATPGGSCHQSGLCFDVHNYIDNKTGARYEIKDCPDSKKPICSFNLLAQKKAAELGIAHPYNWDQPHYFVAVAADSAIIPFIEQQQAIIEQQPVSADYLDELNNELIKKQSEQNTINGN